MESKRGRQSFWKIISLANSFSSYSASNSSNHFLPPILSALTLVQPELVLSLFSLSPSGLLFFQRHLAPHLINSRKGRPLGTLSAASGICNQDKIRKPLRTCQISFSIHKSIRTTLLTFPSLFLQISYQQMGKAGYVPRPRWAHCSELPTGRAALC